MQHGCDDTGEQGPRILGTELFRAIARDELFVEFEPIACVRTGAIRRAEAVMRWDHPAFGVLQSDAFLGAAWRAGALPAVTQVALERALEQCERWHADGEALGVSVDVAPDTFARPAFTALLADTLARYELPAGTLRLVITHHGVLGDTPSMQARVEAVRALGVGLSIDDYGRGSASLTWLRRLPVDELKLDHASLAGPSDAAAATVGMARELGMTVVAEGVDTPSRWTSAHGLGVDAVQGALVGRPMPGETIPAHAARYARLHAALQECLAPA